MRAIRLGLAPMNETKAKILVVDDDLRLRQLLERYLSDQGFTVKAVPDAQGMDRALERELYDLIVLDLMLPAKTALPSAAACAVRPTPSPSSC
jgi:DNA-binding response OmpR family regulator